VYVVNIVLSPELGLLCGKARGWVTVQPKAG
jgi:hypothetical protein